MHLCNFNFDSQRVSRFLSELRSKQFTNALQLFACGYGRRTEFLKLLCHRPPKETGETGQSKRNPKGEVGRLKSLCNSRFRAESDAQPEDAQWIGVTEVFFLGSVTFVISVALARRSRRRRFIAFPTAHRSLKRTNTHEHSQQKV